MSGVLMSTLWLNRCVTHVSAKHVLYRSTCNYKYMYIGYIPVFLLHVVIKGTCRLYTLALYIYYMYELHV